MKVKVTIEEIISQQFEVDVSNEDNLYDEIRDMYKNGTLVLDKPALTYASAAIHEDDGSIEDWMSL